MSAESPIAIRTARNDVVRRCRASADRRSVVWHVGDKMMVNLFFETVIVLCKI